MFKRVMLSIIFITLSTLLLSQVLSDFESGVLESWRSEGDGSCELEDTLGNPGYCLQVNDFVSGDINYAIAPLKFTGDWSIATSTDSLYFDLNVVTTVSNYVSNQWVFEISGPGGVARFTPIDYSPELNIWSSYTAKLDSNLWDIVNGNWIDIIADVDLIRIRAEYMSGSEYCLLDNILLSIDPTIQPVMPLVITDFEDGTYDGWDFEDTDGVTIRTSGGNPGKYCDVDDATGVFSQAIAPPKFLGDWTQLEDAATFMLDLQINQETLTFSDYLIMISGPGGEAVIPMDSSLTKAYNKWETYSYLISEADWTLNSGSWSTLLTDIEEVRIIAEFSSNSEEVWIDNIRISDDIPIANFTSDELILCPGGSVQFEDISINAPIEWYWDFGDGQTSVEENPIHTYDDPGHYDVQLNVTNNFGSDTILAENYIRAVSYTDSLLFCDDFDDDEIHPFWDFGIGTWEEDSGNMKQTSNDTSGGWIGGCFATTGCPGFSNYEVSVDLRSTDNDGIGATFYYQDENNFYLFVWRSQINYRALVKYENGIETELARDSVAYTSGDWYHLDITNHAGNISCSIDESEIFNVIDTTLSMGKAGLYCWANQSSYWNNFCINKVMNPASPLNVQISESTTQVTITWDAVPGAISYSVYSDTDPYGTFSTLEWSGPNTSWSETISEVKKFYYVTASD